MFFSDGKLQYRVRVERPNPLFARMLQQAIGGVEGEIRVMMQYLFQAWGSRGPKKYRDLLLATGTEEVAHIEMLAKAVALNLEGLPLSLQEDGASGHRGARGPTEQLPIPNSFPQTQEHQRFSYVFVDPRVGDAAPLSGRFTEGTSLDGKREFSIVLAEPYGQEPQLAPPPPTGGAQTDQIGGQGLMDKVKSALK